MADHTRKTDTNRRADQDHKDVDKIMKSGKEGDHPIRSLEGDPETNPESKPSNDGRPNRTNDEPEPDEEASMGAGDIPSEIDDKAEGTIDRGADPDVRKKEGS